MLEPEGGLKMNATIKILKSHRSVRKFEDRIVEPEKLEMIIEAAQWAPTSSHFQAYTTIQVEDQVKRKIIAELAGGQKWVAEAPVFLVFCANLQRSKNRWKGLDPLILGNTEMLIMATVDAALVAQKALIAAQVLELGGVFIGGIRNDLTKVNTVLKLPELVYPVFGLCLGYPAEHNPQKPRLPKAVIFKKNYYSETGDDQLLDEYDNQIRNYYSERSKGKQLFTWSEYCATNMTAKPRNYLGNFLKEKGFGLR
jgi:nitroreductase